MEKSEFDNQNLIIERSGIRIELKYESQYSEDKQIEREEYYQKIEISESGNSNLGIRIFNDDKLFWR